MFNVTFCDHWLLATKRIHQKCHCRCTNRIWLQRDCTREYYRLLSHITRSCGWILLVVQRSAQDYVNCEYIGINKNWDALQWKVVSKNCSSWLYQRLWTYKDSLLVCREGSGCVEGSVLSHYIFASPYPWDLLIKSERSCASWLIANHHGLQWEAGMVPYSMAQFYIGCDWYPRWWRFRIR